jgi:5-methylcytosine-specific restriction endonuclease McrA
MYNQSDITEEAILQLWEDFKSIFKEYYQPRKFTKRRYEEPDKKDDEITYKQYKKIDEIETIYAGNIYNLKSLNYEDYLQTEHWKHFVKECKKFFNNECQLCGNEKSLQVHHNNYKNRGRETFNDVVLLCKDCHSKFHNGGDHQ